jgi:multidrug efflux pump subunit AcrA (membrane-fusion protein)
MERNPKDPTNNPAKPRSDGPSVGAGRASRPLDPDHLFWRQFVEAATPKAFCQSWLPLQCRMLKGVRCAMVLLGPADRGPYTPVAVWPDAKMNMGHLTKAAERALKERRGLLIEKDPDPASEKHFPESYHVAYPIEIDTKIHGVVVLGVDEPDPSALQRIMRQLHWGAAWLEILMRRTEASNSDAVNKRLQAVLDLTASTVEHKDYQAAAMAFVTRMAKDFECDRVSLGFASRASIRITAMSHSADFGKQTNLVRAIGKAMDEAVDQQAVIVYPTSTDTTPAAVRAHGELQHQHDSGSICTLPIEIDGKYRGALTLERSAERPFQAHQVELFQTVAGLAGPILFVKRSEERWLIRKAVDAFVRQLKRLIGAGYFVRKLVVIGLTAVVVFFSLYTVDYRVNAPTVIEGEVQRVVAAPFNGYVKEAPVRPGDIVRSGDILGIIDDRDFKLERLKWATEKEQYAKQYNEALANHDRAQIRILRAKIGQADAQIALLDEQLARCRISAPFDGVIMSGDLSQSLGAPVERGQILFEVAPLDAYRVIVEVDERDIGNIAVGQQSELMLPSMAGDVFPFTVVKVTPVSTAKEGRNYFRVEGRLEQATTHLRPGMEGIGKITVDRRKLIWVWTHEAIDWLRLQLWRWWP